MPELSFALNIDPAKKEAFALATALTCCLVTVVCVFVRIAISGHVRTAVTFDSARTVVVSDPVSLDVAFDSVVTAAAYAARIDVASDHWKNSVASDHWKNAVVSGQLTASSDFVRILVCPSLRDGASRLCCSSSVLDHSNPWKDAY